MWLGHYLVPPTQSLGFLYKPVSADEPRRSSPVLIQLRATRTMRKTRLVILPGVRSITQIGCLLLFLACPTIAFKGQEKRDVEPICKFHELKYWWLPFDTGEKDNSTISQKSTGYQCQWDKDMIKGKDNVTDSIQHYYDERIISHGNNIPGQDANNNFNINIGRRWVIQSLPGSSVTIDKLSRRNKHSERRTLERNEIQQFEERSRMERRLERALFIDKERHSSHRSERSVKSRFYSLDRRIVESHLRRSGPQEKDINRRTRSEMLRDSPARLERRETTQQLRKTRDLDEKSRINRRVEHAPAEQKQRVCEMRSKRSTESRDFSTDRKMAESKIRRDIGIHEMDNTRRIRSETLRDSRNEIRDNSRQQYIFRKNISPVRQEPRETTQRSAFINILPKNFAERSRMDRFERGFSSDTEQRLSNRSKRSVESRVLSLDRRTSDSNLGRDNGPQENDTTRRFRSEIRGHRTENRENISPVQNTFLRHNTARTLGRRDSTRRLAFALQSRDFEERTRMNMRIEPSATSDKEHRLLDRRSSVRSVGESRVFPLDRTMDESNPRRDVRLRENDSTRRIRAETLRESRNDNREKISPAQNNVFRQNLSESLERGDSTQRSASPIIQSRNVEERSRLDRRLGRAVTTDKEQGLSEVRRTEMVRDSRNGIPKNISPKLNTRARLNSPERRETTQRSTFAKILSQNLEVRSRIDRFERFVSTDKEQRLSERRLKRSLESRVSPLNRRVAEFNHRRDTRINEKDSSRRIRSEKIIDSRNENREVFSPVQNSLFRQTSLERQELRDSTRRSAFAIVQSRDFERRFRMDRRLERAVTTDKEERMSEIRKTVRSVESHLFSHDRRIAESNLRQEVRLHENDSIRRTRSEMIRYSRSENRENLSSLQNTIRQRNSWERRENNPRAAFAIIQVNELDEQSIKDRRLKRAVSLNKLIHLTNIRSKRSLESRDNTLRPQNTLRKEISPVHRETTQRSKFANILPKDLEERSRMDRRFERVMSIDKEQRFSDRSVGSAQSHEPSLDRRMDESNLRRDIGVREKDSTRRIRSETLRDSRNEKLRNSSPLRNSLLRQQSPGHLERMDLTRRSAFAIVQSRDFNRRSRMDRRLERAATTTKKQRLSEGRTVLSFESRLFSLDKRMEESNLRQDVRLRENDSNRRIRSGTLRDSRNENRENIFPVQNILLQQKSAGTLERRDSNQNVKERSRVDRGLERDLPADKLQSLSDRRSKRSVESRFLSLDRRIRNSDLRQDNRQQENDSTRRTRSEIRESRNENGEKISTVQNTVLRQILERQERRDSTPPSAFAGIQSRDFEGRSRMERRLQRETPTEKQQFLSERRLGRVVSTDKDHHLSERRSLVSSQSRVLSPDRRTRNSDLRRDNRQQENDSTRRIRSENREYRNENRESISPAQNTLLQQKSPEHQDRRDSTRRSAFASIQSRDFEGRSRMDRRLERDLPADKIQSLSDRRSKRSVESRVLSLDRRTRNSDLRRDNRQQENDSTRRIRSEIRESRNENRESISPAQNTLLRQKSPERQDRRDSTRRSAFASIQSRDFFDGQFRMDRRLERDLPADKIQSLSDRRSKRSVASRVLPLDRRTRNSDLRGDNRQQENDSTRRIRSEIREYRNENRESISPAQNTLLRQKSPERQDRRDSTRRSAFASIQSRDFFDGQSRMDRRLERDLPADKIQSLSDRRSKRSVESRVLSLDRRTRNSDLRRDNRQQENDSTRKIRSEIREYRNENRESISPAQNTLLREKSPERQDRRDSTRRSPFASIQSRDFEERSRMDRRLERDLPAEKLQFLSDRRSKRSVESRVLSLDRRTRNSDLRRDNRQQENDSTRRIRSEIREYRNENRESISPAQNTLLREKSPERQDRRDSTRRSAFASIQSRDFEERSRMDRRLERDLPAEKLQFLSDRRSKRSVESRVLSLDRITRNSDLRRDNRQQENDSTRRIRSEVRDSRNENRLRDVRERNEELVRSQRALDRRNLQIQKSKERRTLPDRVHISLERKFEASIISEKLNNYDRREKVSRINQRYIQERGTTLNKRGSDVRLAKTTSLERLLVSTDKSFDKVQIKRREERYLDNAQNRLSDSSTFDIENRASRSERFIRVRRDTQEIRDTSNKQFLASGFDQRRISNVLIQEKHDDESRLQTRKNAKTVQRRTTYDSVRHFKRQETVGNNKRILSQEKQIRNELMTSTIKMRNDISYSKQSTRSSLRHAESPELKSTQEAVSMRRHDSVLDISQNYDEFQIFNAQKNAPFFPSWIGEMISVLKKAVTGNDTEENILKHPLDLGLSWINKYLPGFSYELQIPKLRPDSEMSNDKGHLLQDVVMGSVIAGYFVSSIHLKMRDYQNFICIF